MLRTEAEIVRCSACGANNRVSGEKIEKGLTPVCGQCHAPLSVHREPQEVTDGTFAAEVERSPVPVLVDLWAPWCGPCRMVAPAIDKLAGEFGGRARFAKLNIDQNPATTDRFRVESIPTLLIMKDGREVDRLVGLHPYAVIKHHLERFTG